MSIYDRVITKQDLINKDSTVCGEGLKFFEMYHENGFTAQTFIDSKMKIMQDRHMTWFIGVMLNESKEEALEWSKLIFDNHKVFPVSLLAKLTKYENYCNSLIYGAFLKNKPSLIQSISMLGYGKIMNNTIYRKFLSDNSITKESYPNNFMFLVHKIASKNEHAFKIILENEVFMEVLLNISVHHIDFFRVIDLLDKYYGLFTETQKLLISTKLEIFLQTEIQMSMLIQLCSKKIFRTHSMLSKIMSMAPSKDEIYLLESSLMQSDLEFYEKEFIPFIKGKNIVDFKIKKDIVF